MKTITLNTKNCGNAAGTTGWLSELLETAELEISKLKRNGAPAVFLVQKEGDKKIYTFICCDSENSDPDGLRERDGVRYVYPEEKYDCQGLFKVSLTPACKDAVWSLIYQCVNLFIEWRDGDPEIKISVTAK